MANQILVEVACPNCRNPIDVREHGRHVICDACLSQFILHGRLCPHCNTYHEKQEVICSQCGSALARVCRKCYTSNWAGDEYCSQCGSPMDIFDLLTRHYSGATAQRLQEQMEAARRLKEKEEEASRRRMAELMAIEEARQAELRRRMEIQRKREQQLLLLVSSGVVLFVIVLLIYSLIGGFS